VGSMSEPEVLLSSSTKRSPLKVNIPEDEEGEGVCRTAHQAQSNSSQSIVRTHGTDRAKRPLVERC
jgi:hypothetical protein